MDPIKEAFSRIKEDILSLQEQMIALNQQIEEIKRTLEDKIPTDKEDNQTIQQINPTLNKTPTEDLPFEALKDPISSISTGNGGVPTNSQTDRQSNQQTEKSIDFYTVNSENNEKSDQINQIQRVSEVLESLDSIKKEIRSNFKQLTSQEMVVFSKIYALEEQGFVVDYSLISQKLGLSESSIRDYTHKIIKKGVPLVKIKENNKKVTLSISSDLKKIASLQTILALRNL